MAEPMDVSDAAQNQLRTEDVMDTSSSSCGNPETSSDLQVVTAQPAWSRPQTAVRMRQAQNQHQTSTSAPGSSETTSRKDAADQKKVSTGKTDTQPSAPPDVAVVHMKVDWPEILPDKWKFHLQKALQSWYNSKADGKGSVEILQFLDDGHTAEVEITPSSVLKDLKRATLSFKQLDKTADVHFQKPEKKSSSLTRENLTDEATLNLKDVGAPSNHQGDAETTKASAPLTVPPFFYCYLSKVYKQEVENIEKTFGVNIKAETCISIFAENTNQKDGSESVRRATEAFTELYQKTTKNLKAISVSPADMESDIMKEMLRHISNKENKIMLNMSANEHLLFGQDDITLMVTNHLSSGDGAGVTSLSSSSHNTSHSMEMSRSNTESMQRSQSLNMVLRDTPTQIVMDEAHWKLLTSAFEEQLFEIQKKFGVEFQADLVQGLMMVSARSSRAHQVNLEAHALSALTLLYQKVVTEALTCYLTHAPYTKTSPPGFKEVLAQHTRVQGGEINENWRLFGLPKHLAAAIANMEKDLGQPVCNEKTKKMLENLWNVPQASRFQRGQMETETDAVRGAWQMEAELPDSNQKFDDKAKANDKENKSEDNCSICLDKFIEKKKLKCGHEFCGECLKNSIKSIGEICPLCMTIFGVLKGDQPDGTMDYHHINRKLPGYPNCGTIEIHYNIPSGIQTSSHPNPGQHYCGTTRTAFLPDNTEGNHVLTLLRRAFLQKLIFTVGLSRTSGTENTVTWNDIHHKTCVSGGPQSFGYPDPDYLKRVTEELKAKGIK